MSRFKFYIAGVQHHKLSTIIKDLEEGYDFTLVPEPGNKFDPNAVKIMCLDVMCGYVPKTFSSQVAALTEAIGTENLYCRISKLNPDAKPWEMCEVEIGLISEEPAEETEEFEDNYLEEDEDFETDEED
jgi:hypothetical protein